MGPGIPRINSVRGGFMGGIRTRFDSLFPQKFSRMPTKNEYADYDSQDDYDRQSSFHSRKNYYDKRPRSPYKGNVLLVFKDFYLRPRVPAYDSYL
jgi:hypothetical protein